MWHTSDTSWSPLNARLGHRSRTNIQFVWACKAAEMSPLASGTIDFRQYEHFGIIKLIFIFVDLMASLL